MIWSFLACFVILVTFAIPADGDPGDPDFGPLTVKMREGLLLEGYGKQPKDIFTFEKGDSGRETWCFLGDSGIVEISQKNVSEILVKENRSCSRIYHLGDMVYPVGITSSKDPALTERFLNYQSPFLVPFFFVLGDHEYYGLKIDPWLEVAKGHKNLNFPFFFYGHNVGGVCVIAADTTPFYRGKLNGPKKKEQSEWFEKSVPKYLKDCSFKIYISHHSYDTLNVARKPPGDDYKQPLRKFFENYVLGKFDIIFSGHDHALAYIGNFKGTEQYISGAAGKYTKGNDKEDSEYKMDFEHYVGHNGPGLIYFEIINRKPFHGEVRIVALEGKDLRKRRLVFRKTYGKAP